jgi:hypothetical protein
MHLWLWQVLFDGEATLSDSPCVPTSGNHLYLGRVCRMVYFVRCEFGNSVQLKVDLSLVHNSCPQVHIVVEEHWLNVFTMCWLPSSLYCTLQYSNFSCDENENSTKHFQILGLPNRCRTLALVTQTIFLPIFLWYHEQTHGHT